MNVYYIALTKYKFKKNFLFNITIRINKNVSILNVKDGF